MIRSKCRFCCCCIGWSCIDPVANTTLSFVVVLICIHFIKRVSGKQDKRWHGETSGSRKSKWNRLRGVDAKLCKPDQDCYFSEWQCCSSIRMQCGFFLKRSWMKETWNRKNQQRVKRLKGEAGCIAQFNAQSYVSYFLVLYFYWWLVN